ncbi:MAG: class I SAM-dependent methyltransferase [Sandaracinaceae bacterium]
MDVLTGLSEETNYSMGQLQGIVAAWVLSSPFERNNKVSHDSGHVDEADYTKQSVYSILYSMYRQVGTVKDEHGTPYEFTFNTWGYAWPEGWGPPPSGPRDPQRFGRNAYTGLFHFDEVQKYVADRDGFVHIVEMGCGTGAGADHICESVFPKCTYEAVDMQMGGVTTCRKKFVPKHKHRLVATRADATRLPMDDEVADIVVVNETHVTDQGEVMTEEDRKFFRSAKRILKPGGFLVWGNAIPDIAWQPCFDFMESIGMEVKQVDDVTEEAVVARDQDKERIHVYIEQALDKFHGFKTPLLGASKRHEAAMAMKNLCRDPGTQLYDDMVTRADTYKVAMIQKKA